MPEQVVVQHVVGADVAFDGRFSAQHSEPLVWKLVELRFDQYLVHCERRSVCHYQ